MASKGRPKPGQKKYAREKRLAEKYPGLPEMSDEIAELCQWPQTDADEAKCSAEIARVSRAIRTTCKHAREPGDEPVELRVIAMADVLVAETRRGGVR